MMQSGKVAVFLDSRPEFADFFLRIRCAGGNRMSSMNTCASQQAQPNVIVGTRRLITGRKKVCLIFHRIEILVIVENAFDFMQSYAPVVAKMAPHY